jgi:WD40 repeat protein
MLALAAPTADSKAAEADVFLLRDTATGDAVGPLRGPPGRPTYARFSQDGRILAAGYGDGAVILWDVAARTRRAVVPGPKAGNVSDLAFAPRSDLLAVAYAGTVKFGPDQRLVADTPGSVVLLGTGGERLGALPAGGPLAFAADGRTLYATGARGSVVAWDVAARSESRRFPHDGLSIDRFAVSPDGSRLAVEATEVQPARRTCVAVWDAASGARLALVREPAWDGQCLAFSPDGRTLATGHGHSFVEGGHVRLRDPDTLRERLLLRHQYAVKSLSFAPDGGAVAAADAVGVRLWDAREGRELLRLPGRESVRFLPDGRAVLVGTGDSARPVRVLRAASPNEVAARDAALANDLRRGDRPDR